MIGREQIQCIPTPNICHRSGTVVFPAPPSLVVANFEDDFDRVEWVPAGGETYFEIYQANPPLYVPALVATWPAGSPNYYLFNTTTQDTVRFWVSASLRGIPSAMVEADRIGKPSITSLVQVAAGSAECTVVWTAVSMTLDYEVWYQINGGAWIPYTSTPLLTSPVATDGTMVGPGDILGARVRSGADGPWSDVVNVALIHYAAPVITAYSQNSPGSSPVTVNYSSAGPHDFEVEGRLNGGAWSNVYTGDETDASWDTGGGLDDVVGVRVRDGGSGGTWSAISSLTLA